MTTISATPVLVSQHAITGKRIATLLLRYPRFIHAEFMTHRMFSRNAASSRAIPVAKLIKDVLDDPAVPLHWGKNQPGMQASEQCDVRVNSPHGEDVWSREDAWRHAMSLAVQMAEEFSVAGYHKQIVNRLIEPFAHITVVVTATEWANFLALRDHPDAEPHIQILAREIRKALDDAIPQIIQPGAWHLPFFETEDVEGKDLGDDWLTSALKLSVARCASTSYKTVDGFDMTLEKACDIYDKLLAAQPIHASPAEHQAQADDATRIGYPGDCYYKFANTRQWGNFRHFRQYRKMLPHEFVPG